MLLGVLPYGKMPDRIPPATASTSCGKDTLEMQRIMLKREARRGPTGAVHTAITEGFRLQRVFNNRHIETLFRDSPP